MISAKQEQLERLFESTTRISLALLGGSIAGYGVGARYDYPSTTAADPKVQSVVGSGSRLPRRPPQALPTRRPPSLADASPNTPRLSRRVLMTASWGRNCFFFSLVLETCRFVSPTLQLWEIVSPPTTMEDDPEHVRKLRLQLRPYCAIGDYTIGGGLAGLAAGPLWGKYTSGVGPLVKLPPTGPFLLRGLFIGSAIGLAGGLIQAAVDLLEQQYTPVDEVKDETASETDPYEKEGKT